MVDPAEATPLLQAFVSEMPEVQGAILLTPDGLPLTTALPEGMDAERVAAMAAAILSLGQRIGRDLSVGGIDRILVHGDQGIGVLTSCTKDTLVLTLANAEAKQGLLFVEIGRLIRTIQAMARE